MRLLKCQENGDFSLTENLLHEDLPRYAILSHTWGPDKEEVTFEDITSRLDSAQKKVGYKKIKFCSEQAAKDGLQHFWVDTCCIKKSSESELSASINSMYRWYQEATRCYVYLADVPQVEWEMAFAGSKWFTRGWTLQELLAPTSVEFFSSEGVLLGDKQSMRLQIHEITGIAFGALLGSPVTSFSVAERRGWAAKRVTKLEEDEAYCLFGILGISMAPRYGEGREKAFKRLESKISKASNERWEQVENPLSISEVLEAADSELELDRIEYERCPQTGAWLLGCDEYTQFIKADGSACLHLCGKAGSGKTFLTANVIDRLRTATPDSSKTSLGYFFCDAKTDSSDRRTSMSVLRAITAQQLEKIQDVDPAFVRTNLEAIVSGKRKKTELTEVQLVGILQKCLQRFDTCYIVVDAVDECDDWQRMLQVFIRLLELKPCTLKLFLSSQKVLGIPYVISCLPAAQKHVINVTEYATHSDIELFLERRMKTIDLRALGTQDQARDLLMRGCDGLFLLIRLRLDVLFLEILPLSTDVSKALSDVPSEIFSIYERLMAKLSDQHRSIAQMLFVWVIHARRPMNVNELSEVYRREFNDEITSLQIETLTSGLIEIHLGVVRISHSTVRDFILLYNWGSQARMHAMNQQDSINTRLASTCIEYMGTPSLVAEILSKGDVTEDFAERWPLIDYAARFWLEHLRLSSSGDHGLAKRVAQFINSDVALAWWVYYANQLKIYDWWSVPQVSAEIGAWSHSTSEWSEPATATANIIHSLCQQHVSLLESRPPPLKKGLYIPALIRLSGQNMEFGNYAEAESLLERAREHSEDAQSNNEKLLRYQALLDLSDVLHQEGRHQESLNLCKELQLQTEHLGDYGRRYWIGATRLIGQINCDLGEYEESEQVLQSLQREVESVFGRNDPETLATMNTLALIYFKLGKYADAQALWDIQYFQKVLGENHPSTLTGMENLASFYSVTGEAEKAVRLVVRVRKLRQIRESIHSVSSIRTEIGLSAAQQALGKLTDLSPLQRLFETTSTRLGQDHFLVIDLKSALADAYASMGDAVRAEALEHEVVQRMMQRLGGAHQWVLEHKVRWATRQLNLGKYKATVDLLLEVQKLRNQRDMVLHCDILSVLAHARRGQGKLNDADRLGNELLDLRERLSGKDGANVLAAMGDLALTKRALGERREAERLEEQVLQRRKEMSNDDEPFVLKAMSNLASTKLSLSKPDEAEVLLERVLQVRERLCDKDSHDILITKASLALVKRYVGKLEEAESIQVYILECRKKPSNGNENSLSILSAMAALSKTKRVRGKLEEAENLQERVLALQKELGGGEEDGMGPDVLAAMANLAKTKQERGKLDEAEELQVRVLNRREKTEDENSPEVLNVMGDLALTKQAQSMFEEAERLQERVLELQGMTGDEYITDDPNIMCAMQDLASTKLVMNKLEDAETLYARVLELRRSIGPDYGPGVLIAMANLAVAKSRQGKTKEAEELQVRVLELRGVTGDDYITDDIEVIIAMENLAYTRQELGRLDEAERLFEHVLELRRRAEDHDGPGVTTAMKNLALVQHANGKSDDAATLLQEAIRLQQNQSDGYSRSLMSAMNALAEIQSDRRHYEEAEQLYSRLLELCQGFQTVGVAQNRNFLTAMENLAVFKRERGQLEEAEILQERAFQLRRAATADENSPRIINVAEMLALTKRERGDLAEAERLGSLVVELRRRTGALDINICSAMSNLALTRRYQGNLLEAEEIEEEALELLQRIRNEQQVGPEQSNAETRAMGIMGWIKEGLGKLQEAERLYERQMELHRLADTESSVTSLNSMGSLGNLKAIKGELVEAERLYQREVDLRSENFPNDDKDLQISQECLSVVQQLRRERSAQNTVTVEGNMSGDGSVVWVIVGVLLGTSIAWRVWKWCRISSIPS